MTDIFVFGSNLAGRHGKGAALHAREKFGAVYGCGRGRTGNAYAIPTKGAERTGRLSVLSLDDIQLYVAEFIDYAREHPELAFEVTEIGCGLAGYTPEQIAPMFRGVPSNVLLPLNFLEYHRL